MHLTTKPEQVHDPNRHTLRIRAYGNLDGWFYSILNAEDEQLLNRDFGLLPSDYQCWNPHSATLYSLAQAQRFIEKHFPSSRVVMICTAAPSVIGRRRRAA